MEVNSKCEREGERGQDVAHGLIIFNSRRRPDTSQVGGWRKRRRVESRREKGGKERRGEEKRGEERRGNEKR